MHTNLIIAILIYLLFYIDYNLTTQVNAAAPTKIPIRSPSRRPTRRPTPPGVPCVCNYGIGCYKDSNCCPGLLCSLNPYNPYAPGQCLEDPQYTSSSLTGCYKSQTDYGCKSPGSNTGCCNPFATCGAKFSYICDFQYNCTMNYISPHPSSRPSSAPSSDPSVSPSSQPTGSPSSNPTNPTSQPSFYPTRIPSMQPSSKPSQPSTQPSFQPISNPTDQPTSQPFDNPSAQPTYQPFSHPTGQPSLQPSMKPSSQPFNHPTCQPSFQPSTQPSRQPFSYPTDQPSRQPFSKPSSQPYSKPTKYPTNQPSNQPTSQPLRKPSANPTLQPTKQPSSRPSKQPQNNPISLPTTQPSDHPSRQPSSQPLSFPTQQPSQQPLSKPSKQPTSVPTKQPSSQPNRKPFSLPTTQPTFQPYRNPSKQPSCRPSNQPSSQPSRQPSNNPSLQPTNQPLTKPTRNPSTQPSSQPLRRPSSQPSKQPTTQPSSKPSTSPTFYPSRRPSKQPISAPSSQPTKQPSKQPTRNPSSNPSCRPSKFPSGQPSSQPNRNPTNQPSNQPTFQPIDKPSRQPSRIPSTNPSRQPIKGPSTQPTTNPSSQPYSSPTNQPNRKPSMQPTNNPSTQPSKHPSSQPTSKPSSQPSRLPSMIPVSSPSVQPSMQPSVQPFSQPSSQPSTQPTNFPSEQPLVYPTTIPSLQPLNEPTVLPSVQPTSQPSTRPDGFPTSQPSKQPSGIPSHCPTSIPTFFPSVQPSEKPSKTPTFQPSTQPSNQPSKRPTEQPSKQPSSQPTKQPYALPTKQPNSYPSSQPTKQPSQQPIIDPSRQPTSQPSKKPSKQPSCQPTQQPLSAPSIKPTVQPTIEPFVNPTNQPSDSPSTIPSKLPSTQPTCSPSKFPSNQPSTVPTTQPIFFNSSYIIANMTTPNFDENYITAFVYTIATTLGLEVRNVEYYAANITRRSLITTYFSFPNTEIAISMAQYPQFKSNSVETINFFVDKLNTVVYSGVATEIFISKLHSLGVYPVVPPAIVAVYSKVGYFHYPTYSPTQAIKPNGINTTLIFGLVFGFLGLLCIAIPSFLVYRNIMNKKMKKSLPLAPKDDFAYGDLYSSNNEGTEKYLQQYMSSTMNLKTHSSGGNEGFVQEMALFDTMGVDQRNQSSDESSSVLSRNVEVGKMVSYDDNGTRDISYYMIPMQTISEYDAIEETIDLPFPKSVDNSNNKSKIPFLTKLIKSNSTENSATSPDNLQSWISIQPKSEDFHNSSDSSKVEPPSITSSNPRSFLSYFITSKSDESLEAKGIKNASVPATKNIDDNASLKSQISNKTEATASTESSSESLSFFSQLFNSISQSSKPQVSEEETKYSEINRQVQAVEYVPTSSVVIEPRVAHIPKKNDPVSKIHEYFDDSNIDNDSVSQNGSLFRFLNDNNTVEEIDIFSLSKSESNEADFSRDIRYIKPTALRLSRSIGNTEDTNDYFNSRFVTPTYNENNSVHSSPSDLFLNFSSDSSSDDNDSNYTIRRSEAQVRKATMKKMKALSNRSSPHLSPPPNDNISIAEIPNKDDTYFNLAKSIGSPDQKTNNDNFMKELDNFKQMFPPSSKGKVPRSPEKGFGKKENEVVDMLITSVRTVLVEKDKVRKKKGSSSQVDSEANRSNHLSDISFDNEISILRQLEEKNNEKDDPHETSPSSSTSNSSRINRQPKSLLHINRNDANANTDHFEFDDLDRDTQKSFGCEIFELVKGISPEKKVIPAAVKIIREPMKTTVNINSLNNRKIDSVQPPVSVKFKEIRHKFEKMIEDNVNPKISKNIRENRVDD